METDKLPCSEKLAFDTKEAAEGAAIYARYLHDSQLKVYSCKHCNLWHLSSA